MFRKLVGIVTFAGLCMTTVLAQESPESAAPKRRLLEIGISANAYRGDLASSYQKWASAFQAGIKLNHSRRLSGHFGLAIGTVTGQNPAYVFTGPSDVPPTPNRYFRSTFFSLNYDLQVHVWRTKHWTAYVSQGVGFMRFTARDDQNRDLQSNLATRPTDETYSNVSVVFPTQAGLMYLLPNEYGVGLQAGWLNPITDYLDNISQWGNRNKKDNVFWVKFLFVVPLPVNKK